MTIQVECHHPGLRSSIQVVSCRMVMDFGDNNYSGILCKKANWISNKVIIKHKRLLVTSRNWEIMMSFKIQIHHTVNNYGQNTAVALLLAANGAPLLISDWFLKFKENKILCITLNCVQRLAFACNINGLVITTRNSITNLFWSW